MTAFVAGVRLQLALFRRNPGHLMVFVTVPFFAAIFLSGADHAGRPDLVPYAVLGPALVALWVLALDLAGSVIDGDRAHGTFELLVATPSAPSHVLAGRVSTITVLGLGTLAETLLVAAVGFSATLPVFHPGALAATLVATALAMTGTSTAMAALFVAARSAGRFANALGYPFYILGGLVAPVSLLPWWVQPFSRLTFLYWSAELLRDTTRPAPVTDLAWRLAAVCCLGGVAYLVGVRLTGRVVDGLRTKGTVGLS
ncbi:ABC transporter permease [Virgisporangium aurantiacum]|uniref:ABC-2 type transporter transmembrane domain-containing protein n=1 Tax=Virgisporangium aurantiacum TaxID=175570 RepID=A0A8J3ZDI9_9ACTN|nr:ABC transporter permease [Virgisporangium aurantiacum]GIJ62209.1 hypothetical protein Vau01_097250 [Virgisporangium aurantiacum]